MLYLIILCHIPSSLFSKCVFSLLCQIPLCQIPLCSIPISCYTTFRYTTFRYTWFQIAHLSVITDSCSPLYLIPLSLIALYLIPVLIYLIPLCPIPVYLIPVLHVIIVSVIPGSLHPLHHLPAFCSGTTWAQFIPGRRGRNNNAHFLRNGERLRLI